MGTEKSRFSSIDDMYNHIKLWGLHGKTLSKGPHKHDQTCSRVLEHRSKDNILRVGDLVWGKVKSHPWWPGQIYDENLLPHEVQHTKKDGSVLVVFFGDCTYRWLHHDKIIPFEPYFNEKSEKTKIQAFVEAVNEAIDELQRRAALGLTCFCHSPSNLQPTAIDGLFSVDVRGYAPGAIYSMDQIEKSRDGFQPHEMVSFLKLLARSPRSTVDISRIMNQARVTAYRKAVYEEDDKTYDEAFDELEDTEMHGSSTCVDVAAEISGSPAPNCGNYGKASAYWKMRRSEVSKALEKFKSSQTLEGEHLEDYSKESRNVKIIRERRDESPPHDKGQKDSLKFLEKFQSTLYKNSCPLESLDEYEKIKMKKRAHWECQEQMARKVELRNPKSLCISKKSADQKLLTPLEQDTICIQEELPAHSETKFHEESTLKADVNMQLTEFDGFEKELIEGSGVDGIHSFEGEAHEMSFQGVSLQSNSEMKALLRELPEEVNSKCVSNAGIQYECKFDNLDERIVAINRKYGMNKDWKSRYQQNLAAIGTSDFSNQLTNLLQMCNDIVGEIEGSQN